MKRFKSVRIQLAAGLVGTLILISPSVYAQSDGTSPEDFKSQLDRVESMMKPALERDRGDKSSHEKKEDGFLKNDPEKRIEELEKTFTKGDEERALRGRVRKQTKELSKLKTLNALPSILKMSMDKRREKRNKQIKNLFNRLKQSPSRVNPNDLDASEMDSACSDGVDFTQFKTLADQMNSQPLQFLKQHGSKLLKEQDEKAKEEKIKNLQKLASHFDALASKNKSEKDPGGVMDEDFSPEARMERLRDSEKEQGGQIAKLRKSLVKAVFSELIPQLSKMKENDERLAELANKFADNLEEFRKASLDAAMKNVKKLKKNCKGLVDQLGRDAPLAPNTLFNTAYQWVVSYHKGQADYWANPEFLKNVAEVAQNLKCRDAASQIEGLFGDNLKKAINGMRGASDPTTLLDGALKTMGAIGNSQAQVGKAVKPLMKDCEYAAENVKSIKNFIANVQNQAQQAKEKEREKRAQQQEQNGEQQGMAPQQGKQHKGKFGNGKNPGSDAMTHQAGGNSRF